MSKHENIYATPYEFTLFWLFDYFAFYFQKTKGGNVFVFFLEFTARTFQYFEFKDFEKTRYGMGKSF